MLVPVSEAAGAHFGKANDVDVSARGRMETIKFPGLHGVQEAAD